MEVRAFSFPKKLNYMLSQKHACLEQCGTNGFRVLDCEQFEKEVLQKYFKTDRMASFKRQLNIYGFTRIQEGPRKNTYHHEDFIIGDYERIKGVTRVNNKKRCGNGKHRGETLSGDESDSSTSSCNMDCETGFKFKRIKQEKAACHGGSWELLEKSFFKYKERSYSEVKAADERRRLNCPRRPDLVMDDGLNGRSSSGLLGLSESPLPLSLGGLERKHSISFPLELGDLTREHSLHISGELNLDDEVGLPISDFRPAQRTCSLQMSLLPLDLDGSLGAIDGKDDFPPMPKLDALQRGISTGTWGLLEQLCS